MSHSVEGFNNEEFTIWCSPRWIFSKVGSTVIFITCCNILQHTETHCNTLQHTAGHCNKSTLQWFSLPAATHGNTLQHTATHCNKSALQWFSLLNRVAKLALSSLLCCIFSMSHSKVYDETLLTIRHVSSYFKVKYSHLKVKYSHFKVKYSHFKVQCSVENSLCLILNCMMRLCRVFGMSILILRYRILYV